ncbi:MAG: TIGR04282 family arsenosugar biosynthesis glycosyltransferase [Chloroflexota bacterium]
MTRRALMVVAKQPSPGQTKTRLSPPLTGDHAAALYECFLRDTLEIIRAARKLCPFDPIITYLPEGGESYFRQLAPDFGLLLQQGAGLSERLHNAIEYCLTTGGYDQAAIMDSDSPTLRPEYLNAAFAELDRADMTFGRVDDGGYYLIGLKKPAPRLFLEVTMSTPTVAHDTLTCAAKENLSVHLLPTAFDIDYGVDLRRLIDELHTLPIHFAPHTRRFLQANPDIESRV